MLIIACMKKILPAIAWVIITTLLLIIPGKEFPQENWFDKIWLDKWVHLFLFALMVWLWCRAFLYPGRTTSELRRIFLYVLLITIIYGTGMEFVQRYLVANRSFDTGDIIADAFGAVIGYIYSLRTYIKK
jgi:VanZ family protein